MDGHIKNSKKLLPRRELLLACVTLPVAKAAWAQSRVAPDDGQQEWRAFQARFVKTDGRIIDTGNGGISHSEGQGVGLLFAEHFDDAPTFERILGWTNDVLRCRTDALHAWRYQPAGGGGVTDKNNASDGDILIACALARAGTRWQRPAYTQAATYIARDILTHLVRDDGQRTLLLPGSDGFETADATTINPSY